MGIAAFGHSRWRAATQVQMALLRGACEPLLASRYDMHEIENLPAPVQRYFRAVLKDGQPLVATATCRLHAAMLGLFTVAKVQGDGEIARSERMRYFAEMVWYPTALLPSQGVR